MFSTPILVSLLFPLIVSAKDATSKLFQWQFSNDAISTQLPTCQELPVVVKSYKSDNSTHGDAPYYMTSFAMNGLPVTTLLGTDTNKLSWTVTQPVGSQLLLGVVDTNGSSGGIPPRIFTVVAGQSTQCVQTPAPSTFSVSSNVTDQLTTCQPWGIRVKGGVPPYTITLAQPNSPVVTNASFGMGDDAFTYINRADTNSKLMAAISDFTGQWANGTLIIDTVGSSNVDCIGLVSSSGNSTQLDLDAQQRSSSEAANKKKKTGIIVGVVVTLVVLILIALGALFFFLRRRRTIREKIEIDAAPRQYDVQLQQDQFAHAPKSPSSQGPSSATGGEFDPYSPGGYIDPSRDGANSNSASVRPGFTNFPTPGHARSKASEAALDAARARAEQGYGTSEGGSSTGASRSLSANSASVGRGYSARAQRNDLPSLPPGEQEEIIIQHQDGGQPVVRELPPPYADRTNLNRNSVGPDI